MSALSEAAYYFQLYGTQQTTYIVHNAQHSLFTLERSWSVRDNNKYVKVGNWKQWGVFVRCRQELFCHLFALSSYPMQRQLYPQTDPKINAKTYLMFPFYISLPIL